MAGLVMLLGDIAMNEKRYTDASRHYKESSQIYLSMHSGDILNTDVTTAMRKLRLSQIATGKE